MTKTAEKREQKYWHGRHPKDYLLAHNPVRAVDVNQAHGVNGFRVMWIPPEWRVEGWRACNCGWRPDLGTHYAPAAYATLGPSRALRTSV